VSKRLEVVYINGAPSTPGYLLALLMELSHVPRGLTEIAELGSAIRDTRYARQPAQYVNTSIRSTLVCQYALPFRGFYGPDLTQPSLSEPFSVSSM